MPKTFVKPLTYDGAHQEHLPMQDGQYIDKALIAVDESAPNALSVTDEGLRVTADALVSEDPDNQLKAQDGKLYVAPASTPQQDVANLVADIDDNQIQIQGDKLYVAPIEAPDVQASDLVSNAEDNQLKVNDNRLYVAPVEVPDPTPGELVSADEGNLLGVGLDGKLAVKADNLPKQSVVSADEGNIIREGTDGGAFVDGNDLLSNGDINLLTISEVDHKILLRKSDVLANLTVVSDDPGNLIGTGSDGGVYMSKDELISEDDDVLTTDSHGKLVTELDMDYNTTTGELRLLGVDGAEVGHAIVPTSTSALRSVEFTRSMPSADGEDVEGDYFVTLAFKFDSQDAWDGGDGVKFTTVKDTPAVQNVDYEMKSTVGTGVFPDHVKAVFLGQQVEQDITAGTPNTIDFPDGSRLILTWNTSTGTSINFQASFTPGIGIELGSFLRMAWLLADGSVQDVYLEMTDIYSAGNGISIDDTGLVSVVVSSTGGLQVDGDGVAVKVDPDGGLQTSEEGTSIKIDETGGLQTTEDGTSIKIDETGGLQTNESGTSIKVDPEGGLQTGENGTSIKTDPGSGLVTGPNGTGIDDVWLDNQVTDQIRNTELVTAGNGIEVTTTETGKQVAVVGSDSINSEAGGVSVNETWLDQQITDKVKGDASLVTADDSINVTPTDTGVQVGVDTGWLDQQITDQIKNDETLLVKGNGITLTATATGREIAADAGTGVIVDANGINVDQTWLNNRITDKVKGDATLITGDDSINATPTETGTQLGVDGDWLAEQVTEQVRTDTGLIQAGNGITINVTDNGKTISANAGTGIVSDTNGISVNEEWLAQQVTDKVIEDTSLVTAGNGMSVTPTETGVQVAVVGSDSVVSDGTGIKVNEEWLNQQVSDRVESGGLVTAGDGIDITAADGKAEVAVDNTVVRTSGNQTIAGVKNFTDDIELRHTAEPWIYMNSSSVTKGTPPSAAVNAGLAFYDGTNYDYGETSRLASRIGCIAFAAETTGSYATILSASKPEAGSSEITQLALRYPASGDPYASAPTTPAAASSNEIVTVDYLKGANSGVVHTTGAESIDGTKTFNDTIFMDGVGSQGIYKIFPNVNKGTAPAATVYTSLLGLDDSVSGPADAGDQTKRLVMLEMGVSPNSTSANLYAYKNEADVTTRATLGVLFPNEGDEYAYAPTTPASASANEIVTVNYLKGANSGVVHTTGIETISGLKTFQQDVMISGGSVGDSTPELDMLFATWSPGVTPTSDYQCGIVVHQGPSNDSRAISNVYFIYDTNGEAHAHLRTRRIDSSDSTYYGLEVVVPNTGDPYATAPNTRTTPTDNEIITYDFLQKFVEENGGGGASISDFNTVTNFNVDAFGESLPSGGTWLVLRVEDKNFNGSSAGLAYVYFSIHPGGTVFKNRGDNSVYICAVRIA